ncbi:MAG: hypothetical protein ACKOC5_05770 [Chloroflexota bacterium]
MKPPFNRLPPAIRRRLTTENLYALLLCLALIAILIATADSAPQWIYQGF